VQTQGFLSLYKGIGATLIGIVPYASLKLTFYQMLKNWFYFSGTQERRMSDTANFLFGALAGGMAVTITYPTDLMRRRVQIILFGGSGAKASYSLIVKDIWHKSGIKGFYAGLPATYCKILPAISLTFMLNERIKYMLGVTEGKH